METRFVYFFPLISLVKKNTTNQLFSSHFQFWKYLGIYYIFSAQLKTEWFDIDEPCDTGDTEDVTQNLAYVNTYPKSAPFRMCPKLYRSGVEFQTIHGREINQDKQKLYVDYNKENLVCLNEHQHTKPPPPDYWYI